MLEDGSIERARRTAVELAGVEAKHLVAKLPSTTKATGFPDQVVATLDQFVSHVIPEMLPIGLALERAWAQQADESMR